VAPLRWQTLSSCTSIHTNKKTEENFFLKKGVKFAEGLKPPPPPSVFYMRKAFSCFRCEKLKVLFLKLNRAVGMLSGLKSKDYSDRLKELKMVTLSDRTEKLDMRNVQEKVL
jgi:hypothetical protein